MTYVARQIASMLLAVVAMPFALVADALIGLSCWVGEDE